MADAAEQAAAKRAQLLAAWYSEQLDGVPLSEHPVTLRLVEDIGDLEYWPAAALQLHRRTLKRQRGSHGTGVMQHYTRWYVIVTLLVNGVDPRKLVDFLFARGSISHSTSGNAAKHIIGILLDHKCGTLKVDKQVPRVEMVSGPSGRWGPHKFTSDVQLVKIREGILPGYVTNANGARVLGYDSVITGLERKMKGPKRCLEAVRPRNDWDGTGLPSEAYRGCDRMMAAFHPASTSNCHLSNCDELGLHLKLGWYNWLGARNHDLAMCRLYQMTDKRVRAKEREEQILSMRYKPEEQGFKPDYEAALKKAKF